MPARPVDVHRVVVLLAHVGAAGAAGDGHGARPEPVPPADEVRLEVHRRRVPRVLAGVLAGVRPRRLTRARAPVATGDAGADAGAPGEVPRGHVGLQPHDHALEPPARGVPVPAGLGCDATRPRVGGVGVTGRGGGVAAAEVGESGPAARLRREGARDSRRGVQAPPARDARRVVGLARRRLVQSLPAATAPIAATADDEALPVVPAQR